MPKDRKKRPASGTIPLPEAVYPEVTLPFLLRWQPFDGKTRDLFAWINDRFVARVDKGSTLAEPRSPREPRLDCQFCQTPHPHSRSSSAYLASASSAFSLL